MQRYEGRKKTIEMFRVAKPQEEWPDNLIYGIFASHTNTHTTWHVHCARTL